MLNCGQFEQWTNYNYINTQTFKNQNFNHLNILIINNKIMGEYPVHRERIVRFVTIQQMTLNFLFKT